MNNESDTTQPREILSSDDAEISRLIKGLKRVAAPPDFDVRVRARIAKGRPAEPRGFRFPQFARYAVGTISVIAVAGLLGYIWLFNASRVEEAPVAGPGPSVQRPQIDFPSNVGVVTPVRTSDEAIASSSSPQTPGNPPRPVSKDTERDLPPAGSGNDVRKPAPDDQALSGDKKLYPKGLSHTDLPKPKEFDIGPKTTTREVLALLGIDAKFDRGAWRVNSVGSLTQAERVGVKAGDVIEAVNDKPIKAKTTFGRSFSVKNLQVKRDGQVLNLNLDLSKK